MISVFVLSGCSAIDTFTRTKIGQPASENVVSGSAGAQGSKGSNMVIRCEKPLGTVALMEDVNSKAILLQHRLPSDPTPIMNIVAHQSGCLQIANRSAGLDVIMKEKELEERGMLTGSPEKKVQLARVDYTITPNIVFSDKNAGGIGAGASIGSLFGPLGAIAGGIMGSMQKMEAQVILLLVDNSTGLQIASATGEASKTDIGLGGSMFGFGSSAFGGAGIAGWQSTDEGKIVAAAFVDAYNKLIQQMPAYKPYTASVDESVATH